ncbi:histidine phosphatase family protein [Streptococcus orisasini]|uniref:histidine phosphatase family protein n=1 Tax=Streptococcus orisasini TaxID=1080071 RepID=UPI00070EAD10|nr:histidine phosphatase family protein [Streptococcus orisasini]
MTETKLYIARHGKTMFNTIGRAQGWSDTPLTKFGEEGIRELGVGLKAAKIPFKAAFSSDSGRTMQTMEIILREIGHENLPYTRDKRIREWCFGSLDGGYDGDLFQGVLPRTAAFNTGKTFTEVTYPELAASLVEVDTANWAEPWEVIENRIYGGFEAIAQSIEQSGGGNAIVVSHGLTIGTFMWLIDHEQQKTSIDNGSVSVVSYENQKFSIETIADMGYRHQGRQILKETNEKKI